MSAVATRCASGSGAGRAVMIDTDEPDALEAAIDARLAARGR
jgi:hypothetical protein